MIVNKQCEGQLNLLLIFPRASWTKYHEIGYQYTRCAYTSVYFISTKCSRIYLINSQLGEIDDVYFINISNQQLKVYRFVSYKYCCNVI